ncbi:M23 family metallopeptidase, partial [Arthrobacter sp. HMWF013]|uniref:M23 family metallopeptidase n=1 Tax=Arthrobacter sp. HMWF013 TaxID=2056849 RepID=UPI002159CF87
MRVLAAAVAVSASALALGLPWIPPPGKTSDVGPAALSAGPATSVVTPPSVGPSGTVEQTPLPAPAGGFAIDARALVPFHRTIVTSVAKGEQPKLNVASAGLKRPPAGSLMAPLEVLNESSHFGYRVSPLTGSGGDFHLGQDYAARCGTRVYAADTGVVRAAGWHPWGGGNRVEIDHGNGLITTYNHLEAVA